MDKKRKINYLALWLPPLIWGAIIFSFSSYQTPVVSTITWQDFVVKKTYHVIEYAIFTVLLYRAMKESGVEKKKAGFYAILTAVLYGLSDEFHQSFTPGRTPRLRDVIFDTIGSTLAIYGIWKLLPKAPKKLVNWAERLQLL